MRFLWAWAFLLLILYPTPAWAYVDPGIMASLYQLVYVLIFGVLLGWIIKPYRYFRSFFKSEAVSKEHQESTASDAEVDREDGVD